MGFFFFREHWLNLCGLGIPVSGQESRSKGCKRRQKAGALIETFFGVSCLVFSV